MGTLTVAEKAYAAAVLDGEGCVMIRNPAPTVFCLWIEIVNTDRRLTDWMQERWGGSCHKHSHREEDGNRKPRWHLQICARKALQLLLDVLPYLVLKKEQAQWGIKFQSQMRYWGSTPRPASYIALQHQAHYEIHRLNQRGRKQWRAPKLAGPPRGL